MYHHHVYCNDWTTGNRSGRTRNPEFCGHELSEWQAFYRFMERHLKGV